MKNPFISFISKIKFRSLPLLVVWAATFAIAVNAQEMGPSETAQIESDHGQFVEAGDSGTFKDARQIIPKEPSSRFSPFDLQIQTESLEQLREKPIRFVRIESSYGQNLLEKDKEVSGHSGFFKRLSGGEIKRPFERLLSETKFATDDEPIMSAADDDDPPALPPKDRFHWRSAISQSVMMLGIQHGYALVAQEKTRRALANGNFFTDYWRSARSVQGWDDGNRFLTNYLAHPMQGGLTGFIFVQNHDRAKKQKFADSKQYWKDRFKAFVWSTAWSTQFELGPISQSSIGNVGMYGHMGYVDLVMTPTVGTAWLISEEAIDRYVIRHIETRSVMLKVLTRMFLNPMRTVANLLRFREPWYRDRPFGH